MIRFDFTTLRIFVAVYNLKSFTRAAEQEHIASSAVSKRISDLETELGVALFKRHPRGVSATPAGDALIRHAGRLFEQANDMAAELSVYAGGERGQVRIHAHSSAMSRFLPPAIASFTKNYPQVQINLREESSPSVIQALHDGIADIGIVASNVWLPKGLSARNWRKDQLIALLPKSDSLSAKSRVSFANIARHPLISFESGTSLQVLLEAAADKMGVKLNIQLEVATMWTAVAMARAGLGVAIVPQWLADQADDSLACLTLTDDWAKRHLMVVTRERTRLQSSCRLMLSHLFGPGHINSR